MWNRIKNESKYFFESKYFLLLISVLTILNYYFKLGIYTYIETAVFLILMIMSKSQFLYLPSIIIFILGGGLTKAPDYKSFGFVLLCIIGVVLVGFVTYFIVDTRKKIACITLSNSFVSTTILLAFGMLLSIIKSVKPLTTLSALGGFLVNLVVMYLVLTTVKSNDKSKDKLAQSFVSIFYVIFIMVIFRFFELLQNNEIKNIFFSKVNFHLGWDYSNHYCEMLVISFVFSCYTLITKWKKLEIYIKIFYTFPLISIIAFCILLSARGALLGLFFSLIIGFIYIIIKNRHSKKFVVISLSIMLICIISVIILYSCFEFLIDKNLNKNNILNGRQELWSVAWRHFKEHWFLGTGYGTQRIFILSDTLQLVYNYHNYFFQISTAGMVGIILFIVYLINISWHCIGKIDCYIVAFVAIFALFMSSGFVDTLFFSNKIMPLFSICLCYLDLKPKELDFERKWQKKLNIDILC